MALDVFVIVTRTSQAFPHTHNLSSLFVLLGAEAGVGVGDLDCQLFGSFDDRLALLRGDSMSDFGTVLAVLHHQDFQFLKANANN